MKIIFSEATVFKVNAVIEILLSKKKDLILNLIGESHEFIDYFSREY